jgi:hypothetical protein
MGPDSSGEHRPHQLARSSGNSTSGRPVRGSHASSWTRRSGVGNSNIRAWISRSRAPALGDAYVQAGVASPTYTDPTLTVGVTVIKANHLKEDLHPEATASNPGCSRALLLALHGPARRCSCGANRRAPAHPRAVQTVHPALLPLAAETSGHRAVAGGVGGATTSSRMRSTARDRIRSTRTMMPRIGRVPASSSPVATPRQGSATVRHEGLIVPVANYARHERGSAASRSPSPRKLTLMTPIMIAAVGATSSHEPSSK